MENLLIILSLFQRANGMRLLRQLFPNIVMVVGLLLVLAIMVSALLIGGLVAAYFIFVGYGITSLMAMIYVAILTLITMVVVVMVTNAYMQRIRQMPRTLLEQSPLTFRAMDMLNAFMDGLLTR